MNKALANKNLRIKNQEILHISDFNALPQELFEASFVQGNSLWSPDYFKMIAETCDQDFEQHWLLHYADSGKLIAAAAFQVFNFSGKNYRFEFNYYGLNTLLSEIGKTLLKYLIRPFSIKILQQGNAFTTGDFSLLCDTTEISKADWIQKIEEWQWNVFLKNRKDINAVLWKDFNQEELADFTFLEQRDYLKFEVQPTMTFEIPEEWKNFEDYLEAMQSKYRTRMRKVFKKGKAVKAKWLNAVEIQENIEQLESLYQQVVAPSNFKMTALPVDHLWKLKQNESSGFQVLAFYDPKGLIGFISFYRAGNDMYAGYMGIDRDVQFEYDQYLRTLLELIKAGVEQDFKKIFFGRTALEIKSSTGAVPEKLFLFTRHRKPFVNAFLQPLVERLSKQAEWNQRHPFK